MLTKRLSDPLKRHIFSFLVEGNLDLIHQEQKTRTDETYYGNPASSLTIIRRINKECRDATQLWQDKINSFVNNTLNPYLTANPEFKNFFVRALKGPLTRNNFAVKDLLNPIFDRMADMPIQAAIEMLIQTLVECESWKDLPALENKENNPQSDLRACFRMLPELRNMLRKDSNKLSMFDLNDVFNEFKFNLIERIIALRFKVESKKSEASIVPLEIKQTKLVYEERASSTSKAILCLVLCCVLPLITSAVCIGELVPDRTSGKDPALIVISIMAVCCAFAVFGGFIERRYEMQQAQISRGFRDRFFREIDSYQALETNEPSEAKASDTPVAELRIDIP